MDHNETGCQTPDRPILCIMNCGFFGSAATMNMCSKCHKETVHKEEQAKLAASSIESIVNGSTTKSKELVTGLVNVQPEIVGTNVVNAQVEVVSSDSTSSEKTGPSRCMMCHKRVGLTGFNCRCGNLFCSTHRYSDKHDCQFDYRGVGQSAIAKANPVIKAKKVDNI